MKKLSESSQTLPFYLFVAGIFLMIVCQDLFSNGMFLDGLVYSTISINLANGLGSFWNPHFTATLMPDFHEHPPLAFGIQYIFYKLLGESRFIEKLYSLLTVVIVGFIILKIRDNNKIKDTYTILSEIPQGSIINIKPDMYEDCILHAYFGRFKNVSYDRILGITL
jgi:hypothetical protein